MLEIIQNDLQEKRENSPNPKRLNNIRQIGNPEGKIRIYLEDYVYTYLHQTPERGEECIGILLGQTQSGEGRTDLFISGAIGLYSEQELNERVFFEEETWEKLYRIMKDYFEDLEVMGWYQIQLKEQVTLTPEMERVRKRYFDGSGIVMFLEDFLENEEAFYVYDGSSVVRKGGYYIYYERNPQMQEYMVQVRKPKRQVEKERMPVPQAVMKPQGQDKVVEHYRMRLQEKQARQHQNKSLWHGVVYTMSGAMIFAVAVMAVTMLNSVEKIQKVESTLTALAQKDNTAVDEREETTQQEASPQEASSDNKESSVVVETIAGNVTPESEKAEGEDSSGDGKTDSGDGKTDNGDGKTDSGEDKTDSETDSSGDGKTDSGDSATGSSGDSDSKADSSKKDDAEDQKDSEEQKESGDGDKSDRAEKEANQSVATEDQTQVWLDQGYYDVQKGDSLDEICQKIYKTTAVKQQICDLNGITDENKLNAGQRLKLP